MGGRVMTGLVILAVASACATITARVPVEGPSVTELIGDWEGVYSSRETGRSGSILFRLHALADTAQGTVFMESKPSDDPANTGVVRVPESARTPAATPLYIRFVRVRDLEVRGILEPYRDPQCGCLLNTEFIGRIDGDVIEGTFRSEGEGFHHLPASGEWRVKRVSR
jgi:hypothetical protein